MRILPLAGVDLEPDPWEVALAAAQTIEEVEALPDKVAKHGGSSHDQRDHGNWARGMSSPQLSREVDEPDEGFTVHVPSGARPTTGFSVAVPGHEESIALSKVSPQWVQGYRRRHREALADPETNFGGWVENGRAYLDVSIVFTDYQEAYDAMIEWEQQAMYDLDNLESVFNPEYGT